MRLQPSHCLGDRGLDAYFSPPCAVQSLIAIEGGRIPRRLWEPAAGDGTGMVLPLHAAGFHVVASDIADYGCPDCTVASTSGKGRVNGARPSNLLLIRFLARARRSAGVTVANRERAAAASANRQNRSQSAEQAWTT